MAADALSSTRPRPVLPGLLKDAALAAVVAFALALPLVGFHLADVPGGLAIEPRFHWVAIGVAAVFFGRLALGLLGRLRVPEAGIAPLARLTGWLGDRVAWIGWMAGGFALVLPFLPFSDRYILDLGITVLIYVMLGWGLNVVVGLAGLLDLGYVAFYAVGAYSYALFATYFDLSFWICLPIAGLLAASFGVVLGFPVLRLRGDYLAIVTLGFGEMVRLVLLNWQALTGGPSGIGSIPRPTLFGMPFSANPPEGVTAVHEFLGIDFNPEHRVIFLYFIILLLALLTNLFTLRLRKLPIGRAWEALREDEIACRSLGINPTNTKLSAFGIGAMLAGFAGSFFATRQGFISPESFNFLESAIILAIVVLGGMGSQVGVVVAAALLVLLPEFGREFAQYRMLFFGLAMVLIMVWRPQGLLAHRDPSLRLHPPGGPVASPPGVSGVP